MTPKNLYQLGIRPALGFLLTSMATMEAIRQQVAIAMQESNLEHRRQIGGPARSYYQFELIGVKEVLTHPATRDMARNLCASLDYSPDPNVIYEAIEHNDVLASGFARLLLWRDPKPMPTNQQDGWNYYERNWRPGKPHPERWERSWDIATSLILEIGK